MNQPTTTQGDILAYLDRVISKREQSAQEARDGGEGRWHSGWREDYFACPDDKPEEGETIGSGVSDERDRTVVYDEGRPSKAQSIHIALNDPESVLRRCAADRKMIGLMATETSETGGQPLASRLLRQLAEGYGWTEGAL
ncbi:DUF6221 family protein (plasmid) [Streptomyces anulatus]|uniref:DUF6221 family protein n=1 Tax=Streptomyces anulatus TaxID=1892 RepID=UPI0032537F4B